MTSRLDNIVSRQRMNRTRDFMFATCVAIMTVVSMSGVGAVAAATLTR